MEPIQTPITGNEDRGNLSSPYQALVDFYHAFNHHDMAGPGMLHHNSRCGGKEVMGFARAGVS
jgi:hypothetical protein